jgi:hypothetical protein
MLSSETFSLAAIVKDAVFWNIFTGGNSEGCCLLEHFHWRQ